MKLVWALVLTAASTPPPVLDGAAYHCAPTLAQFCDGNGCKSYQPATRIVIDEGNSTLWRCSIGKADDCDVYPAEFTRAGAYLTVGMPKRAGFVKVDADLRYTEVQSLMDGIYINRGSCGEGPPTIVLPLPK